MPFIYIEGIETTLLTLFGCILGFIGGKVDSALNNTFFYDFSLRIHKLSNFHLPIISLFTFVRSHRDPEEKIAGTNPDSNKVPNQRKNAKLICF
jgi:hypothetical protein